MNGVGLQNRWRVDGGANRLPRIEHIVDQHDALSSMETGIFRDADDRLMAEAWRISRRDTVMSRAPAGNGAGDVMFAAIRRKRHRRDGEITNELEGVGS